MKDVYVVGIDIGGTASKGVLLSASGRVVDSVVTVGLNYQLVGEEFVVATVAYMLEFLTRSGQEIQGVGVGVAGCGREEEQRALEQRIREMGTFEVVVSSDIETAAYAALLGRPGVVVVGGTGMVAYGKDPRGQTVRKGGYGFLLGDEGSGFWLGLMGLHAAIRDAEGRGQGTVLTEMILEHVGRDSYLEAIPYFYADPQKRIADLAPVVLDAALKQDPVADDIVRRGTEEIAQLTLSVVRALDFGPKVPVKLSGGIFQNQYYFHRTRQEIQEKLPEARVEHSVATPANGAALLVLQRILTPSRS